MLSTQRNVSRGVESRERMILLEVWSKQWERLHREVTFELDLDFGHFFKLRGRRGKAGKAFWGKRKRSGEWDHTGGGQG